MKKKTIIAPKSWIYESILLFHFLSFGEKKRDKEKMFNFLFNFLYLCFLSIINIGNMSINHFPRCKTFNEESWNFLATLKFRANYVLIYLCLFFYNSNYYKRIDKGKFLWYIIVYQINFKTRQLCYLSLWQLLRIELRAWFSNYMNFKHLLSVTNFDNNFKLFN